MSNADAADALKQHEEMAARRARNAQRFSPQAPGPMGEPWRPVMTEQQRKEHDQYVKDHDLPF